MAMPRFAADGVTDNTPAFAAVLADLTRQPDATLDLTDGVYAISDTLELPTRVSLRMAPGARILALPGFRGTAVVRKARGTKSEHVYSGRIAGGIVDGGGQAVMGVHVPCACRMDVSDVEVVDCTVRGIMIGDAEQGGWYEVNVSRVRCSVNKPLRHAPGSIGLQYLHCTDSLINMVVIIGYETGVWSQSGSNDFSQVHVWNHTENGPLQNCFVCRSWNDSWNQCYADSPFNGGQPCNGFLVDAPFNRFTACRVYNNTMTIPDTVTGFLITERGTHGTYIGNHFTAHDGHALKDAFAGPMEAGTFIGNTYNPQVHGGLVNRIPSAEGGLSPVPALRIG